MIIKICGLKTVPEAVAAAEAGADMIGLNFYEPSPRYVDEETAKKICAALPRGVMKVGVFVNKSVDQILDTAQFCGLHAVQIHGDFPAKDPRALAPLKVIRAFNISTKADLKRLSGVSADFLLIDAPVKGMHGGTGQKCDWKLASHAMAYGKVLLAGGLRPENVREAIRQASPAGVDVASGVETAPGVKSIALIRNFIEAVRGTG